MVVPTPSIATPFDSWESVVGEILVLGVLVLVSLFDDELPAALSSLEDRAKR
jgi:hypothetical protein